MKRIKIVDIYKKMRKRWKINPSVRIKPSEKIYKREKKVKWEEE